MTRRAVTEDGNGGGRAMGKKTFRVCVYVICVQ
jgi:hypothetical protein